MSGSYHEWEPAPALRELVACVWERQVAPGPTAETRVLPDGCVDLVWRDDGKSFVAGPDTGPVLHRTPGGLKVVGLRFRPGAAGAGLGLPASELRDQRVPLDALWGNAGEVLGERLAAADGQGRLRLLQEAVHARQREGARGDPLVGAAIAALGSDGTRVAALGDRLGVSERELRRRFGRAVGYGPKRLDRILRFRRFLALASTGRPGEEHSLAFWAAELGYADQAHLTRSVRELSGLTPRELLATA